MEKMVMVGREISFDDLLECFPYEEESRRGEPLLTYSDIHVVHESGEEVMRFELVEGTKDTYLRKS